MSVDQIRAALDRIDATPRDGFLEGIEERLVAAWSDDVELDVDDLPVDVSAIAPQLRRLRRRWVLAAAAALVMLVLGLRAFVADRDPSPTTVAASGGMWPQASLEEVRQAQELADAGDPDYTWQVDSALVSLEWFEHLSDTGSEIVTRFLREELGWEQFLFNPHADLDNIEGDHEGVIRGVLYLRCAPGETNSLYPGDPQGGGCAPTIDDVRYETVSLDLTQPGRRGPEEDLTPGERAGIWVVSGWRMVAPFRQADPRMVEADATARLEQFLQARIDGAGAEGFVEVNGLSDLDEAPLLYTTSAGSPYERYEIEVVSGPTWPDGDTELAVRLYADGGQTVVEQQIYGFSGGFSLEERSTTENGQPWAVQYSFFDGEVTASAPAPWKHAFEYNAALVLGEDNFSDRNIELVADPIPIAPGCERPGQAPADARALAASIRADPDLVTTAPVSATIAGAEGVVFDLTIAGDASICGVMTPGPGAGYGARRSEGQLARGSRMRLYLLDHPEGSSATQILAIAIVAPEARFDAVIEAATPIIESIEFHAD